MSLKQYFVYILTNQSHTVLYTSVTYDIRRRVIEHRSGKCGEFTLRYKVCTLVYFKKGDDIQNAIFREKQIKAGSRRRKLELINSLNPDWEDLFDNYFGNPES